MSRPDPDDELVRASRVLARSSIELIKLLEAYADRVSGDSENDGQQQRRKRHQGNRAS